MSSRLGWWILRSSSVGLAGLALGACAPEVAEDDAPLPAEVRVTPSATIFTGEHDDDAQGASSVVALKIGAQPLKFELCSGTVVAPNVVLTARHCVVKAATPLIACDERGRSRNGPHVASTRAPSEIEVYTGPAPLFGEKPDAVGHAIVAPQADHFCDGDIALVVLDRTLPSVPPLAVRLDRGVAPGERVRAVGYGKSDKNVPIGTRLRKPGVEVLAMGSGVSPSNTALGPHEFEVGRATCKGDSGGPAISEETGAVVGVVSRGAGCLEDFGNVYTTTGGWAELFDEALAVAHAPRIVAETGHAPRTRSLAVEPPAAPEPSLAPAAEGSACALAPGGRRTAGPLALLVVVGCGLVLATRRGARAPRLSAPRPSAPHSPPRPRAARRGSSRSPSPL